MLQVLPAERGADGRCPQSVGGASVMAASDGSGDGGWRQGCDGHELSSPIDGIGHSCGWQPGSKVSMMIIRPPHQGQAIQNRRAVALTLTVGTVLPIDSGLL